MTISIGRRILNEFDRAVELEWLETNGVGGWASSTLSGAHSRRYHGLLVAALLPPVGRTVLVSRLDETIQVGADRFELGCRRHAWGVAPQGHRHLRRFERDLFAVFEFEVGAATLRRTIAAIDGENTTVVLYEVTAAPSAVTIELQPFLTCRDVHELGANGLATAVDFDGRTLSWSPEEGGVTVHVVVPGAEFDFDPAWSEGLRYHVEERRGFDADEDLWVPGALRRELQPGERFGVIVTTESTTDRDPFALVEAEAARRERAVRCSAADGRLGRRLTLAADQFVVRRGDDLRTIIAGYHWFADWGRDTMIALPGLCLATGRHDDAAKILRAFARHVDQGMLPNRFPDDGDAPEYNTVDATLWFFVAVWRYLEVTEDDALVRDELLPVLRDIFAWHERGTRYGIGVDPRDGLLAAGVDGVQLTWMDAKVGDRVVTPRHGKAVEINALWYNVLMICAALEERFGDLTVAERLTVRAQDVLRTFRATFWDDTRGYLADVVDDDGVDPSLRPNQLLAVSLPFPALESVEAASVVDVVEQRLFTPNGLRSLDPADPAYRARYTGGPLDRDASYHQGAVWGWLLGPFFTAVVRTRGDRGRQQVRAWIERAAAHLSDGGVVGSVSEIFEPEAPHTPRGAVAQAWSLAELLRVLVDDLGDHRSLDA